MTPVSKPPTRKPTSVFVSVSVTGPRRFLLRAHEERHAHVEPSHRQDEQDHGHPQRLRIDHDATRTHPPTSGSRTETSTSAITSAPPAPEPHRQHPRAEDQETKPEQEQSPDPFELLHRRRLAGTRLGRWRGLGRNGHSRRRRPLLRQRIDHQHACRRSRRVHPGRQQRRRRPRGREGMRPLRGRAQRG